MSMRMSAGFCSAAMRSPSSAVSASATTYPFACSTSRMSRRLLSLSSTRRIRSHGMWWHRKRERERRAVADLALHPQTAAVQLDELSRQRESHSGALPLARVVRPHLPKLLEDRLLIL